MSRDRALECPAALQALIEREPGNAGASRPRAQAHCLSVVRDRFRERAILALLKATRPSAVVGCVRAVAIDAVNRVFRGWAPAHVGQEVLERLAPAVTNRDASSAVAVVVLGVWIKATFAKVTPRAIFRAAIRASAPVAMRLAARRRQFALEASARSRKTVAHVSEAKRLVSAAIATAMRKWADYFKNFQSPVTGWHGVIVTCVGTPQ